MNDDANSTCTYGSEKINGQVKEIKESKEIKLIGKNEGGLSRKQGFYAGLCYTIPGNKEFFAKEINKEQGDTQAKIAIAQAFYSMIVHTPAVVGQQTIQETECKNRECMLYSKANVSGKRYSLFEKTVRTHVNLHSLLYGLCDRPMNTLMLQDRQGNNQLLGIDLDCNGNQFFAFNEKYLPGNELFHDNFLNAKRSRLRIVEDECNKLEKINYEEFLHRCVMNFKILGIEKEEETWRTFKAFLDAACNYKKALSDCFNENYVKEKSEKCCIVKIKDFFAGYGCEYKAPRLVQRAIQRDNEKFFSFYNDILRKTVKDVVSEYGSDDWRKKHPISNVNNIQSKINFDNFYASTRGIC